VSISPQNTPPRHRHTSAVWNTDIALQHDDGGSLVVTHQSADWVLVILFEDRSPAVHDQHHRAAVGHDRQGFISRRSTQECAGRAHSRPEPAVCPLPTSRRLPGRDCGHKKRHRQQTMPRSHGVPTRNRAWPVTHVYPEVRAGITDRAHGVRQHSVSFHQ